MISRQGLAGIICIMYINKQLASKVLPTGFNVSPVCASALDTMLNDA